MSETNDKSTEKNDSAENQNDKDKNESKDKNTDKSSQNDNSQESNLTDEQWEAAFKHPRFKSLNERASKAEKELEKIRKQQEADTESKLKEEKKWQELAEKKEKEVEEMKSKITLSSKTQSVITEAIKLGIKDTDAAVKLIDLESITLDNDGHVTNAAEVVKALAEAKPYLVTGEPSKNIGNDVNPTDTEGDKKVWRASELRMKMRDHAWYAKHKDEIDTAIKEGRVNESL